jgi:uncharacterized protein CbrC (UPF0167 family)
VSESIKIGTKAIKEQSISIEEVHQHIEELDHVVSAFHDVQAALGKHLSCSPYYIDCFHCCN